MSRISPNLEIKKINWDQRLFNFKEGFRRIGAKI